MVTLPPAFLMRVSSTSSSGLWSYDISTALPAGARNRVLNCQQQPGFIQQTGARLVATLNGRSRITLYRFPSYYKFSFTRLRNEVINLNAKIKFLISHYWLNMALWALTQRSRKQENWINQRNPVHVCNAKLNIIIYNIILNSDQWRAQLISPSIKFV